MSLYRLKSTGEQNLHLTDEVYAAWVKAGNPKADAYEVFELPKQSEPVPVVPEEVPMWAIRAVLDLAGLTPKIDAILEQLPQPDKTIVLRSWEYGNFIRRASPMIAALAAALGKTDAEVDQYFLTAASLNP